MSNSPVSTRKQPARLSAEGIFKVMFDAAPDKDLLFSPLSLEIVLAVLLMGTQGESQKVLREVHYASVHSINKPYTIVVAYYILVKLQSIENIINCNVLDSFNYFSLLLSFPGF